MRFFKKAIRKGMPWSTKGMADGLSGLAHAVENISIAGGRVTWSSDGVPKLIPGASGGASARAPMSHHLRIVSVEVEEETERQLQVFADGPLWQRGETVAEDIDNAVADGKWHTVEQPEGTPEGEVADGLIWSVLRDDVSTVSVIYSAEYPVDPEDPLNPGEPDPALLPGDFVLRALPIGVIADGKIRPIYEGVIYNDPGCAKDPGDDIEELGRDPDPEADPSFTHTAERENTWEARNVAGDGLSEWALVSWIYDSANALEDDYSIYGVVRRRIYDVCGRRWSVGAEEIVKLAETIDHAALHT